MTPQEMVSYWHKSAADDWKTVRNLFAKRDYVKALFFGHLYLEKLLKALVVHETQAPAPFGHRLSILAEKAKLSLSAKQVALLDRVTEYNISTRYPDWQFEFKKKCTKRFCELELAEIEEFGKWLRKMIKP